MRGWKRQFNPRNLTSASRIPNKFDPGAGCAQPLLRARRSINSICSSATLSSHRAPFVLVRSVLIGQQGNFSATAFTSRA